MAAASSGSRAFLSRSALPSEWDRRHYGRHQHVQEYLKVDGLTVKYVGPGESDTQAATIFADKPVPQDVPLYYFEVAIVNRGTNGYIGIGFCTDGVNLGRLPGWEPHSYGYHGDDGHAFHGSGQGRAYGPGFTSGDVVGALLDRSRRTISYFKNGQAVGVAFYDVQEQQLYPCVGMRTKHEEVRANFGGAPFAADLNKLQADFQGRVMADIAAIQLPAVIEVPTPAAASSSGGGGAGALASAAAGTAGGGAGTGAPGNTPELEAAAAACTEAIRGLDSSSGATLATLESATQAYLAALEAASSAGGSGAPGAAAAAAAAGGAPSSSSAAAASKQPARLAGGKASRPLMLYYVFDYLLHRRCWKTAAIIAQEMLAVSSSSSSGSDGSGSSNQAAAAAASAGGEDAAAAEAMDCSMPGVAQQQEDTPMPDAAAAEAPPTTPPEPTAAAAAAAAATAQAGAFSEADVQDALRRQKIYDAVCAGQISESLAIVRAQYGQDVLQHNPRLCFKLRVQQFVELVREACTAAAGQQQQQQPQELSSSSNGAAAAGGSMAIGFEAALAYGRSELGPGSKSPQDEELLSDALSLLAYADPAASPCGHLLRESYRAELAEELNGALLKARGSSGKPLLECAYRQAVVLVEELKRSGVPAALVLDVPGMCGGGGAGSSGGGGGAGGGGS